jgi:hypothetical protein
MGQILFVRLKTTHHDRQRLVFLVNVDIDGDAVESAEATARQTRGAVECCTSPASWRHQPEHGYGKQAKSNDPDM